MDVGQVKFTIVADGLDKTIGKVSALQDSLNSMDGRTYRVGASRRTRDENAYNRAVQRSLRNQKQLINQTQRRADMYHKQSEKRIKDAMKFAKINARNRAYAERMEKEQYAQREKYQKDWETRLARGGARMQTLGATLQNITSPFTNVYRGLAMGVGYRALSKIMESINGAFSRYDTMKNYDKLLKELGINTSKKFAIGTGKAQTAIDNLEQSVLGLPTGLDEIVSAMRTYAGATGDVERATKLAIAANNAYIAGGMDARQQLFTQRQLLSLAGGAELSTNQWDSLRRNAPLAIKAVADSMNTNVQDMIDNLKKGETSGKEFLDVFIKVGTEGKLASAAQKMKQTWNAVSQNISNAMNRAGEGILSTLDEVYKEMDGRTFLQHVLGIDKNGKEVGGGIKGAIDDISKSAQEWIKANPEKLTKFFDNLGKIDWKGIMSGFAQFGLMMGRFYSGLAKTFGTKGLVQMMLWGNLAGKGIQIAGGLTKGLAGPISKLMTLFKFGAGGKVIKGAKDLAKNHGVLVSATQTVGGMAMTWQGVASKAVSVAAIPAIAGSLVLVAKALQEFGKVDIGWGDLQIRLGQAAEAVTAFGVMAGAIGALISGTGPIGWVGTAVTAAGVGAVGGISAVMIAAAKGLNDIAKAEIPSPEKIAEVTDAIYQIGKSFKARNPVEALGIIFDAWTKSSEFKAVKNATDSISGINDMLNLKLPKGWQKKTSKRLEKMMEIAKGLEDIMDAENTELMGKSETNQSFAKGSHAKKAQNTYTARKQRMREFADYVKAYAEGMTDMVNSITAIGNFSTAWKNLPKAKDGTFDSTQLNKRITKIADSFYDLTVAGEGDEGLSPLQKLRKAADQVKGANYAKLTEALGQIPKVIGKIASIQKKLTGNTGLFEGIDLHNSMGVQASPIESLAERLRPMFNAIANISANIPQADGLKRLGVIKKRLAKIPQIISQLKAISTSSDVGGISTTAIHDAVTKIQEALNELEALNDKQVNLKITINGKVTNKAKKEIDDAYKKTKASIDKFDKLPKTKIVSVNLVPNITGVSAVQQAVNAAVASVSAALSRLGSSTSTTVNGSVPHHGPFQMGGLIHRAGGGFAPRGTDTVPAMLTPGEFVLKRRAASMLGHTLLNRLNHLDIRGALSELSVRAAQRSSVVSTTNNTKNISLTMNNNGSSGVGLNRTSGWLNRL